MKQLIFMGIIFVFFLFFIRLYFGERPRIVHIPKYIPDKRAKPREKKKDICKSCKGCGKLNPKGFCCAKPHNDSYPSQCFPNLTKKKCEESNTTFNEYKYKWCK
tara:strand:- start:188 stop:499 length:312 start_codon:yes stop_codon:yes gene_type:complete